MVDSQDFESLLLYYGRSEFFHTMQKTALDGLARYPNQFVFRLYNGIALVLGNKIQEGIRELNPLKGDVDLGIGAIVALLYAHKKCSAVDMEAISSLEKRLGEHLTIANANTFYNASMFCFLSKNVAEARDYIEKSLKLNSQHEQTTVLKAWIEMYQTKVGVSGNIMQKLQQILTGTPSIDANLALVRCFQLRGQLENAINCLIKLSVRHPELNVPLIVIMETQLAALEWDRAYETALRIINLDPTNIAALRIKALLLVVRDGNTKGGISTLQQLLVATERIETGNSKLLLQICQLFARISSRNTDMLTLTLRFVDKLIQLNPTGVGSIIELGNQRMLLGNIKEASICYRSATKLDKSNFFALCGLTLCQLLESGGTEQASQQVEFLSGLRPGDTHPLLLLIKAKIAADSEEAVAFLSKAIEIHMCKLEGHLLGPEYFLHLDPDFLVHIISELLRHSPLRTHNKQGIHPMTDTIHISLKQCISILDVILKCCPSHLHAIYMRSKVFYLCGDFASAHSLLHRIISDIDSTYTDAYLLLAQIQIQQNEYSKALQYLEMALSINFAVRENPKYYLLFGIGQRHQQQYIEAQKSFMAAMHLIGNEATSIEGITSTSNRYHAEMLNHFTVADKVTLYLELIGTYKDIGDAQGVYESERLLQCAMEEFNNTSEEGRLVIAHAEFMLQNANVNKAVELLSAIQPRQPYYIQAKTHLANIYLHNRKDRVAFARCFKELVETCPESESFLMLGEAYMSIQEPDLAVEAYQKAYGMNPQDPHLASKLGRAYVKTHQYTKAIKFYQHAVKMHSGLDLNLAELYLKLRRYKNAEEVLTEEDNKNET